MSGAPAGWQNPKTNWQAADVPLPADFNRVEGNALATELGDRTVDQALAPSGHTGTLRQLLSWLTNRIRAITGGTNWYDAPAATIVGLWGKFHASTGHGHTGAPNDGPKIGAGGLADGAVVEAKIGSGAVTSGKLGALAVIAGKIADGAVDTLARIASGIRTSAGGTEASRLAVTNASGRVGDSEKLGGQAPDAFARVVSGSYVGDGSTSDRTVTVGFTPKLVFVTGPTGDMGAAGLGITGTSSGAGKRAATGTALMDARSGTTGVPAITTNGFLVRHGADYDSLNRDGITYYWVAIG